MTRPSTALKVSLALAVPCLFLAPPLAADSCSIFDSAMSGSAGSSFNVSFTGFTSSDLGTAFDYWTGCSGYGTDIPSLQIGGTGGVPLTITKQVGNSNTSTGSCGETVRRIVNGQLQSATITIWTNQKDGTSCEPLTDSLAHEIGHVFGLDDATASSCLGRIMGNRTVGGTRSVQASDCQVADAQWTTPSETPPPDPDPYCDAYCWTSCVGGSCPSRPPGGYGCPILVDLEGDGIRLTGLDDPVWFDIDADGVLDLLSWTNRGEGLLALDRNGNGVIDNGSELFGNYTRLADGSRALNGYLALAELDTLAFGGNGDGSIDASDVAYSALRVWTDRNHDGVSQPSELQTLTEAGIRRIALDYRRSNRTDRFGNQFRFRGTAWVVGRNGQEHPVLTWDVFFLVASP